MTHHGMLSLLMGYNPWSVRFPMSSWETVRTDCDHPQDCPHAVGILCILGAARTQISWSLAGLIDGVEGKA